MFEPDRRWLYLAEGRLADALLETGDTEAGVAMWQWSIDRRAAEAQADPSSERAQRHLANGYGPLAEQRFTLGRHAEALAWYQRENPLLRGLRARHPQVKALLGRLNERDRDLAGQLPRTVVWPALSGSLGGRSGSSARVGLRQVQRGGQALRGIAQRRPV